MPRDKTASHDKILSIAMDEFLAKGFEAASLSAIAKAAGLTAPALYRHVPDKQALFEELVQPAIDAMRKWMSSHQETWEFSRESWDPDAAWHGNSAIDFMREVVLEYPREFKLIVCRSVGTPYESFVHDYVMGEQQGTLVYLQTLREAGVAVRDIDPDELHMLLTGYTESMFEVLRHDFDREQALRHLATLRDFYVPSWRAYLGF